MLATTSIKADTGFKCAVVFNPDGPQTDLNKVLSGLKEYAWNVGAVRISDNNNYRRIRRYDYAIVLPGSQHPSVINENALGHHLKIALFQLWRNMRVTLEIGSRDSIRVLAIGTVIGTVTEYVELNCTEIKFIRDNSRSYTPAKAKPDKFKIGKVQSISRIAA